MTFKELWNEIEDLDVLPNTAIVQIPESLSDRTKKQLSLLTPQEAVGIISAAIEEVDRGSVRSIDSLVNEKL